MSSVESRAVRKMIGTPARWAPSRLATSKPSMSGEHHVEHHQVRFEARHGGDRLAAGGGRLDLEALEAQRHRHDLDDVRLVVDDEYAAARGGVGRVLLKL